MQAGMWRMNTWFFGPCNGHWPLGNFFLFLSASVTAYLEQRRAFVFLPTRCEMRTLLMFTTVDVYKRQEYTRNND